MNVAVAWLARAVTRAVLLIVLVALSGSVASGQPSMSSAHSSLAYDYDAYSALVPPLGDAVSADASHPALALGSTWKEVPAAVRQLAPGGVVVRQSDLYQAPGSLNGQTGVFEWIVDMGEVTHRRFIPRGTITGFPNQVPPR